MAMRSYTVEEFHSLLKEKGLKPLGKESSGFSLWELEGEPYTVPGPDWAGRYPEYIVNDFFGKLTGNARNISVSHEKCFTVKE